MTRADLPRLIEAAEDADLVLGSRYVPGGGVTDWGAGRQAISRRGSAYARAALGLQVQDLTGGFKVFRREVLEAIDLESLASGATRSRWRPRIARSRRASGWSRCRSSSGTAAWVSRR